MGIDNTNYSVSNSPGSPEISNEENLQKMRSSDPKAFNVKGTQVTDEAKQKEIQKLKDELAEVNSKLSDPNISPEDKSIYKAKKIKLEMRISILETENKGNPKVLDEETQKKIQEIKDKIAELDRMLSELSKFDPNVVKDIKVRYEIQKQQYEEAITRLERSAKSSTLPPNPFKM